MNSLPFLSAIVLVSLDIPVSLLVLFHVLLFIPHPALSLLTPSLDFFTGVFPALFSLFLGVPLSLLFDISLG